MGDPNLPRTSLERNILEGIRYAARRAYEDILEHRRGEKPVRKARLIFSVPEGGAIRLLRLVTDESGGEPDEALYTMAARVTGVSDEHCLFYSGGGSITAILREEMQDFYEPAALEQSFTGRLARLGGRAARNMHLLVSAPIRITSGPVTTGDPEGVSGCDTPESDTLRHAGSGEMVTDAVPECEELDAAFRRCHSQLERLNTACHMRPGVRVFVFDGPSAQRLSGTAFPQLPLTELDEALRCGDHHAVSHALDMFFKALAKDRLSEHVTALCLFKLAAVIGRVCFERGIAEAREPLERLSLLIGSNPDACEDAVRELCAIVFSEDNTNSNKSDFDILRYIENHFREPLSLCRLSDVFDRPQSEIGRVVRDMTGHGFGDYLNSLRIEYAKRLIASSGLKLSVVCRESGFTDYSHFIHIFQQLTGMLPSRYKREFG